MFHKIRQKKKECNVENNTMNEKGERDEMSYR